MKCNLKWNFLENFGRNHRRQLHHPHQRTKNDTLSNSTKRNQKTRTKNRSALWTSSSLTVLVHPTRSGNENCRTILKIAEKCSVISDTKGPEAITRWSDFIAEIYGIESSKSFRYKRLSISISLLHCVLGLVRKKWLYGKNLLYAYQSMFNVLIVA